MAISSWDEWVEEALSKLQSAKVLRSLRPIHLSQKIFGEDTIKLFDGLHQWDRESVQVKISEPTFQKWLHDIPSSGDEVVYEDGTTFYNEGESSQQFRKLLLFSGNDYLGLSSHPAVGEVAAKVVQEHGMGPKGSALICGYTTHHRLLESSLADLKKKEDCLLCPTGFSANMAVMVTLGNLGSLLSSSGKDLKNEKVAIFSDALNHASIIDGIRLAERQNNVEVFVYRHCDMLHLNTMLLSCTNKKKVVVTDSLFSMDGDFAPMVELVELRRRHTFLLVIDDGKLPSTELRLLDSYKEKNWREFVFSCAVAHGTFVCGNNGQGVAEQFNCEKDVDISVGTLSKAAGCHGGFIACSKRWKQLILSRGRSFIFSTAIPVPIAAAAYAALIVAKRETWRRREIWNRVSDFQALTGIAVTSPIISLVVGSEENALQASRYLLKSGLHVSAIRPPTVPANSCRLRVTMSAAHTIDDVKKLVSALSTIVNFQDIIKTSSNRNARL